MKWNLKIGLEIHVQLNTKSKLFSNAINSCSQQPNEYVAPLDIACPGSLPILNEEAVRKSICAGKILNCKIHNISKFDRKHYMYPDLPLGYQITQFYQPICTDGYVVLNSFDNKKIRINRIHIETDAGKLIHDNNIEYIDYNRCGCPLIEIVTEPDFTSSMEVIEFLRKLILNLEYGNVSDCDMEKGNLRCDINISIYNERTYSERVEVKNVNSVEFVKNAIEYEYNRQINLMEKKEKYYQHTRGYRNGETIFMRKKETSSEYRYWRCGNLPILHLSNEYIESIEIPETYDVKMDKYMSLIGNKEIVYKILSESKICNFFENGIKNLNKEESILFANLLACDLMGLCTNGIKPYSFSLDYMIKIAKMHNKLPTKVIKNVLKESFEDNKDPEKIVKDRNLSKITDETIIKNWVKEAKLQDEDAFNKFFSGDIKVKQAIIGIVMKLSKGQVDMNVLDNILLEYKNNGKI